MPEDDYALTPLMKAVLVVVYEWQFETYQSDPVDDDPPVQCRVPHLFVEIPLRRRFTRFKSAIEQLCIDTPLLVQINTWDLCRYPGKWNLPDGRVFEVKDIRNDHDPDPALAVCRTFRRAFLGDSW